MPFCFIIRFLLLATLLELDDPSNASQAVKRAVILAPADGITVLNAALCSYIAELIDEAVKYLKQFQKIIQQNDEPSWLTQEVKYLANPAQYFEKSCRY